MNKPHIGNIVLITATMGQEILLLHKLPWSEKDQLRKAQGKRERVGIDKWGLAGGGNESTDLSDVHAAQRETLQETGLEFPLEAFVKKGVLEGFRQKENLEATSIATIYAVQAWPGMKGKVIINPEEHNRFSWFPIKNMPLDDMIESDRDWIPIILENRLKGLSIRIVFDGDSDKVLSCHMDEAEFE